MKAIHAVIILTLVFLCASIIWEDDDLLPCPEPRGTDPLQHPECYIAPTFIQARAHFLDAAKRVSAEVEELKLPCGLSIAIARLRGKDSSKLLMHVAGTHGVEGFVGSAIQTGFLEHYAQLNATLARDMVFVNGLNPYGMAKWRRANENNVDLNRNSLFSDEAWAIVNARDPNVAGYEDWNELFNPSWGPSVADIFLIFYSVLKGMFVSSFAHMKRAFVTGSYTRKEGIYFGGHELQPSHKALREYLERKGFTKQVRDLILIDVHSGLGPLGNDTLMMSDHLDQAKAIFNSGKAVWDIPWTSPYALELQTNKIGETKNEASLGYDIMVGDLQANYPGIFTDLKIGISVTQEFGTVNGISVVSYNLIDRCIYRRVQLTNIITKAYALIRENQAFHHGTPEDALLASTRLRQMFCPRSQKFARSVLQRGLLVIAQAATL